MRVLYFSDNTSDHNRRFISELAKRGIDVWFLDLTAPELPDGWLPAGVNWHSFERVLSGTDDLASLKEFVPEFQKALQLLRPDLLHAGPVQSCGYIAALSGFHPLLMMSWGSDLLLNANRNMEWRNATEVALRAADGLFCDCDSVLASARNFAPFPTSQIAQFPWGIERGSFGPDGGLVKNPFLQKEKVTLLSTRSWEPVYGIEVLIASFRLALNQDTRLRLVLLGDGSLANWVRRFVDQNGLTEAVLMPGVIPRPDLPSWFRSVAGYISCAISDGTSVSLLEAMATGLPVVVTDIPSNREWIIEGKNGWLAPSGSPEAFADCILRVTSLTLEERVAISDRNRSVVVERADWGRNFPRLLHLYQRLIRAPA